MIPHPTADPAPQPTRPAWLPWSLLLATGFAFGLRALRLSWQPLWWDEGYSIYFATEPLARMLWLTAHDIHPPLYYALLHGWAQLFGPGPEPSRLLSVALGTLAVPTMAWLAWTLWPGRPRLALCAALLLALSPMHLYYSQEVRMYALAMVLGMVSTGALWRLVQKLEAGQGAWEWWLAYLLATTLGLYTLYYLALLTAAQAIWAIWAYRRRWSVLRALSAAWVGALLLYLPWLVYALPKLIDYVAQKVVSDQDAPLAPAGYLLRHLRALLIGHHVEAGDPWVTLLLGALATALIVVAVRAERKGATESNATEQPLPLIAIVLTAPFVAAFLLNLRLPFFPVGGERLLLFVLPYLLLLLARGLDAGSRAVAGAGLAGLGAAAAAGVFAFYTIPRYAEHDYRPVVAQSVQQGRTGDAFLAIFPWMVGYWRAYAPAAIEGPTPLLLGDFAVEYGPEVEVALEGAMAQGAIWFPEPLSFGSDLPPQIEEFLGERTATLENRWISEATRLTAWATLPDPSGAPALRADFGPAQLVGYANAATVTADNSAAPVTLSWTIAPDANLRATVRLLDAEGRVWAQRNVIPSGNADPEHLGLIVPSGTPPGPYQLAIGIGPASGDTLLLPSQEARAEGGLVDLAEITVIAPDPPPALAHYAIPLLTRPVEQGGRRLLGAALPATSTLAGTPLAFELLARADAPQAAPATLIVSLHNRRADAAGWEGWPLPAHPIEGWTPALPYRLPIRFDLPPTLPSGRYQMSIAWRDADGAASTPVAVGAVEIVQRAHRLEPPSGDALAGMERQEPAPQFGTHARLYAAAATQRDNEIAVDLWFEALATLLPSHHLFVHAVEAAGSTVAQCDQPPQSQAGGLAPTGSWIPGEFIHAECTLTLPPNVGPVTLRAGLYEPLHGVRLPVSLDGAVVGDSVTIAVWQEGATQE